MSRLIDADELERAVMSLGEDVVCDDCAYEFVNLIDAQPTIETFEKRNEPKRPKWFTDIHFPTGAFVCSECETRIVEKGVDFYCPKCGQAVKWEC